MGGNRNDPDRWDLPPALLGECREGIVPISMNCPLCRRAWLLDPATIAGDGAMPVKVLGDGLTCECGRRGGLSANPDRRPWVRWLRKTGQAKRLP